MKKNPARLASSIHRAIRIDPEFQALIPPLSADELGQLEANILADGCRDPLVVWRGLLLDGHNRLGICKRHGLNYRITEIQLPDRLAARRWILHNQAGRRNLNPDQLSILRGMAYNLARLGRGRPRKMPQNEAFSECGVRTSERLAQNYGVSRATIERDARFVAEHPAAARQVLSGKKSLTEVQRELRDAERRRRLSRMAKLPSAKYRVVYADPPWRYDSLRDGNVDASDCLKDLSAAEHYPTMSIEELCRLPVKNIVQEDSVLFLWVTSPLLSECWPVIKAWGFEYKASFVWDKVAQLFGHYNSVRHELLLVCTRGSCLPEAEKLEDSVVSIKKSRGHSRKPAEFRKLIDRLYPHGKHIELFAREKAVGWDAYGDQMGR